MASLVDHERAWHELKRIIASKPSHGAGALQIAMAHLELKHEVDAASEVEFLRRFGDHLIESFMGILPPATPDPLSDDDRLAATSPMMDACATIRSPRSDECQPMHLPSRSPAMT